MKKIENQNNRKVNEEKVRNTGGRFLILFVGFLGLALFSGAVFEFSSWSTILFLELTLICLGVSVGTMYTYSLLKIEDKET